MFYFSFSDLSLCAKPNGINCTENYDYEDCEQLNHTNFKNYGCKAIFGYESEFFECSNRMDKKDILFETPPISLQKKRNSINYNTALLFEDVYIYCGKNNFTYENFYQASKEHGFEDCKLIDEKMVTIGDLWSDLIVDFSFNMTEKMNEL